MRGRTSNIHTVPLSTAALTDSDGSAKTGSETLLPPPLQGNWKRSFYFDEKTTFQVLVDNINPGTRPDKWYDAIGWGSFAVNDLGHAAADIALYAVGGNVRGLD